MRLNREQSFLEILMNILLWSERIGFVALALLITGVFVIRSGQLKIGLPVFGLGNLLAVLVVIGLVYCLITLTTSTIGLRAFIVLLLCALPTILTIKLFSTQHLYPGIHDITTDTVDPPVFHAAPEQRIKSDNSLEIKPESIRLQQEAYRDLAPITVTLNAAEAQRLATQTAESLNWVIYNNQLESGVLEAFDQTWLLGFKDDIVIRIRSVDEGSIVDLRSVSRRGRGDIGANTKRIRAFIELFKQNSTTAR
ncbi:MAG: hypothetical protein ACI8P9_002103 [Parasphingorhabdus sp.]